jgi:polysaccharide pyruvyl transferase WcaK-like protein
MPEQKDQILLIRNIFANVGDEAMLCCEIEEIRRFLPNFRLKVLTDDPERIKQLYTVETDYSDTVLTTPFTRPNQRFVHNNLLANGNSLVNVLNKRISGLTTGVMLPLMCRRFVSHSATVNDSSYRPRLPAHQQNLLNNLKSARLVIGGGGLIPSIKGIFLPKVALYQSLPRLGVPYILHGQTVLPESGAEEVYRNAARVLLRDHQRSKQTAVGFGAAAGNLIEKLDPAFNLAPADEKSIPAAILDFLRRPFLAVNLRGWKARNFQAQFANLAKAVNEFHQFNSERRVVFFPMQAYGTDNDLNAIEQVRNQLDPDIESLILPADISPKVLKAVLARSFATITSRYHGAVFGLTAGVPTIGISVSSEYDVKLNGIFSMFAADDFLIPAARLETKDILGRLRNISANGSSIRSKLSEENRKLQTLPGLGEIVTDFLRRPELTETYAEK